MNAQEISMKIKLEGCLLPCDEIERMILRHMENSLEGPRDTIKSLNLQLDRARTALNAIAAGAHNPMWCDEDSECECPPRWAYQGLRESNDPRQSNTPNGSSVQGSS